ncbi:MAG: DUF996 domain-containing protein [Nitrososphaerota archaeon]|jgi:uncharacterized membrane protein|nr:DUF996 domain-containing protein [Nitrososphaerota archaeon]
MSDFGSSKILAGVGSILLLIPAANIVGIILVLIGMKGLSEHYKDDNIYRNAVKGVIFGIIGFITLIMGILSINIISISTASTVHLDEFVVRSTNAVVAVVMLLAILFVFMLLMAIYFRKAFGALADRSGEQLFNTVGTLLLIGAVLTIAFFIGLILVYISFIIAIVAFFSLKAGINTPAHSYTPPPTIPPFQSAPTTNTEANYCSYCGAPVLPGSVFCSRCGRQI